MQLSVALHTQHHRFSAALDHPAFPWCLACQVAQFAHMMHFYQPIVISAPFTALREQPLSQFRSVLVF
jgi:hypothetical protein